MNSWDPHLDYLNIAYTVEALQKAGIKDIDVIGSMPRWFNGLPRQLWIHFKKHHAVPLRMKSGFSPKLFIIDQELTNLCAKLGVNYISPRAILCNEEGCLARLGNENDSLIAWDVLHLTEKGSVFLVSKFPKP